MSKAIQALLSGMFVTFILDFFIFLGIQLNYLKHYNIDVYYNILFADHQNIYLFFIVSIILGIIIIYINNTKLSLIIVAILSLLALSTLTQTIGHSVGESLLMKKNVSLKDKRHVYRGDIYYDGRKQITFYDNELRKIIILNKKDLIK